MSYTFPVPNTYAVPVLPVLNFSVISCSIASSSERTVREREVEIRDLGTSPAQLEKQAWGLLGDLSKITNVDQLLLQMKKYSGTLGDYSGFNSLLIYMQNNNATIVRSANEWKYFGREVKDGEPAISVLYPLGIPSKTGPGKIKDFIEKKRKEGLDDEAIEQLITEKFNTGRTGTAYVFDTEMDNKKEWK